MPMRANESDELVALINRQQIIFRSAAHAVHQQRLRVRLHLLEHGVAAAYFIPRLEVQQRLGGSRRTWVKRDNFSRRAAVEKKRHADRNQQALPLRIRQLEILQITKTSRHAA